MVTLLHKGQSFDGESSEAIYEDDAFCHLMNKDSPSYICSMVTLLHKGQF